MVVLWHASRYIAPYGTGASAALFLPGASFGVDLFFIISGFIMVHATIHNDGSFHYFYNFVVKRVTRIWPLWLSALFLYLFCWIGDYTYFTNPQKVGRLLDSILLLPHIGQGVPPSFDFPLLPMGWTLNYEVYFYAFFGFAMLFGKWRWIAFSLWVTATLVICPLAAGHVNSWTNLVSPLTVYGFKAGYVAQATNPIIWLFVAGVIIGRIYCSDVHISNRFYIRLLLYLTISLVLWQYASHFRTNHGLLNWGFSLIPFMLVLVMTSKTVEIRVPRWLVYLGDISFSLYLVHPMVQEGFDIVMGSWLKLFQIPHGYSAIFITTILSTAVAAVSHRYVETQLCGYLKRTLLLSAN